MRERGRDRGGGRKGKEAEKVVAVRERQREG
jgi:hypothetical protein